MTQNYAWFVEQWATHFAECFQGLSGLAVTANAIAGEPVLPEQNSLVWETAPAGFDNCQITVALAQPYWISLGNTILGAAGVADANEAEQRDTCVELLQQSFASLAHSLGRAIRQEVGFSGGTSPHPQPATSAVAAVEVRVEGSAPVPVTIAFASGFAAFLTVVHPDVTPMQPAFAGPDERGSERPKSAPRTLDLLLEVELPVSVSFGRTQMRLKEAVKLTTGSIVELNRAVTEPVEVIVNNCVIARGEVVVVEGNYGVRIQEIVSREERLRTLF